VRAKELGWGGSARAEASTDGLSKSAAFAREWAPLVALAGVVLGLGFWRLGERSFWYDEAVSGYVATRASPAEFLAHAGREFGWATYYVILRAWSIVGTSDTALRVLSVLAAAASVPLLYLLARRFYGPQVALLAAALLATNAFVIRYAQEARVYTLAVLATIGLLLAFLRALDGPPRRKALWVALAVLAIHLHVFAGLVIGAQGLWLLIARRLNRAWVAAFAAVALASMPLVASFLMGEGLAWIPPLSRNLFLVVLGALPGSSPPMLILYLALSVIGVAALVRWTGEPERHSKLVSIAVGWIVPLAFVPVFPLIAHPLIGLGLYLAITLILALQLTASGQDRRAQPDLASLVLAWIVALVLVAALVTQGPSPSGLALCFAVAVAAGQALLRMRGRDRHAVVLPLAVGWLPALVLAAGLSVTSPMSGALVACAGLALLGAVVIATVWLWRQDRPDGKLVALWWLIPLVLGAVLSIWMPMFIERYYIVVVPAWAMLAAAGLAQIRGLPIRAVIVLLLGIAGFSSLSVSYEQPYEDYRSAAAYLSTRLEPGDQVVYAPATGLISFPLAYYLQAEPRELRLPDSPLDAATALRHASEMGSRVWLLVGSAVREPDADALSRGMATDFDQRLHVAFGLLRVELWEPNQAR
jgi:hypothetical protein